MKEFYDIKVYMDFSERNLSELSGFLINYLIIMNGLSMFC